MNFHTVKLGSRPLLAFPDAASMPVSIRSKAIGCYPAHTWKKQWLRRGLVCATKLGLLDRVFSKEGVPLPGVSGKVFGDWVENMGNFLPSPAKYSAFIWPGDPARGRIYCHLLDAQGNRVGFCKFGLDAQNSRLIEKEALALKQLGAESLQLSRTPKRLFSGKIKEMSYVLVETTPCDTHAIDWNEVSSIDPLIDEYSGSIRLISRLELESLDWWRGIVRVFSNRPWLMNVLHKATADGVEACRVHGDLNRTNVLVGGADTWLLDWERSDESGPAMTDRLCVAVDRLWLESPTDPRGNLLKLKKMFPELRDEKTQGPGVLGLAFLGAVEFTPALSILTEWFPVET